MSNKDVKLNLTITARDEAKTVVEGLARVMAETFDGLGAKLVESMGLSKVAEAFESMNKSAKTNFEGVAKDAATPVSAFDKLAETVFKTRRELETDFEAIKSSFGNASLEAVKASELTVAQLKKIVTAADESSPKIEAFKNKFQESFDAIANTAFKTREQLEKDFERIKMSFDNESLAATKASDLTTEALRKMVMAADETEISVVKSMEKMASSTGTAATHIKESLDFMNLQMAGQMIEQSGKQVTDFFGGAVGAAVGFDQAIVNTSASLNSNLPTGIRTSAKEVDAMREAALSMGKAGFFSANEIGESMNVLARQGIDYKTIMGGAAQSVHDVAAANQSDVANTANVVSDIIHEMGGELKHEFGPNLHDQMTGVGDAMTGAMHHARISMEDFLQTMKYTGPQASVMGAGIGDLSASIALLGQHGIRGSQAGTTLRRMFTNLIPQSKEAAATMDELGMTTKDGGNIFFDAAGKMKSLTEVQSILHDKLGGLNPMLQEQAVKTIFGQYALSGMTAIVNTSSHEYEELTKSVSKSGVTQQLLADKSEGWGMQIQKLRSHWETIRKEIGELLKPAVESIMGVITKLMAIWDSLSTPMKTAIATFGSITGVVLLVGGALLAGVAGIGMLAGAITAALPVLAAIGVPFLIIIGVIAAVIAVVALVAVAWKRDFGGIQEKTAAVWSYLTTTFNAIKTVVVDAVMSAVKAVVSWWDELVDKFRNATGLLKIIIEAYKLYFQAMWETMKFVAHAAVDIIWGVVKAIFTTMRDFIIEIFGALKDIFSGGFKLITGIVDLFIDLLSGNWKAVWKDVQDIVKGAIQLLKGIFEGMWTIIKTPFVFLWDSIKNIFTSIAKDAVAWGSNIIDMFVSGISGAIHKVTDAVKNVANSVKSFLGFSSPTKEGPASNSDQWMPNMMNMLTTGIADHTPKIQSAVNNVALGLNTAFTGTSRTTNNVIPMAANANTGAGRVMNVTINVDGSNAKSSQHLGEMIAQAFRTQIPMVSA